MSLPSMPWFTWFNLSALQEKTLLVVAIIAAASALYCFVVGEITRNNSQMDKLWSILPIAYTWVIAAMSHFNWRTVVIAVLVTLWGVRLTINFGKKGAYKLKFWEGEEDYRWIYLRKQKGFSNKLVWGIFDLLFISCFQNFVVLFISLPSLALMESTASFNWMDIVAILIGFGAFAYELIADAQQMKFQNTKWGMIKAGKKLEELPEPYNLGFNTTGLWNRSRHPNYIGEQSIWMAVYLFSIAAGVAVISWASIGMFLLILVFVGSTRLAESISSSKYPLYKDYQKKVFKYLPIRKYR